MGSMAASGRPLLDVHHLGAGQTGNETWARCVARALEDDGGRPFDLAVTRAGRPHLPPTVSDDRIAPVSSSGARRLALDLPVTVRRRRSSALVVQYTLPLVRVPSVVVVHDLSFERPEAEEWLGRATVLQYRARVRGSVRRASRVLVPTQWTKQDLLQTYAVPEERVLVAPLAVDPALQSALQAPPEPDGRLVVLAVGTVLPRKNLAVAASAVRQLRDAGSDVCLRLVGPTPDAGGATLADLHRRLPVGLEVVGAVTPRELAAEYRSASVLVCPSRFEGFGLTLLEAMAAGLPVVSSHATCLPEVAGDAALLVDPDDVSAWAGAIGQVLGDDQVRERLISLGRLRCSRYSWAETARVLRTALGEVS